MCVVGRHVRLVIAKHALILIAVIERSPTDNKIHPDFRMDFKNKGATVLATPSKI